VKKSAGRKPRHEIQASVATGTEIDQVSENIRKLPVVPHKAVAEVSKLGNL
jgi:hypothetical protein